MLINGPRVRQTQILATRPPLMGPWARMRGARSS